MELRGDAMKESMMNRDSNRVSTSSINTGDYMKQTDVNTQHIMMLIDKGIKKNLMMTGSASGLRARRIYKRLRFLKIITFFGLVVLTIFEKPSWCIQNPEISSTSDCQSVSQPSKYLTMGFSYLDPVISKCLSILMIFILCFFCVLKTYYRKRTKSQQKKDIILISLSTISVIEILVSFIVPAYPFCWVTAFSRVLFLIVFVRQIRHTWVRFMHVLIDCSQMIAFLAIYVLFFALLGRRLFNGSVEGVQYFPDFVTSAFSMLVLLTTSNSPDIMLPAYQENRIYCLFFIIYLLFGVFLLMHLLMALFYYNYQLRYQKQLSKFKDKRDFFLEERFNELDKDKKGYLNRQEAFEMFKQIHDLENYNVGENGNSSKFTIESFDRMFYLLHSNAEDTQENNQVNVNIQNDDVSVKKKQKEKRVYRDEFMRIFEVYELWKYETKLNLFFQDTSDAVDQIAAIQAQKSKNKDDSNKKSSCFTQLESIVRSVTYEYVWNIISIFQLVELALRIQYYDQNISQVSIWIVYQVVINCVFLISLVLDWIVLGFFKSYYRHPRVFAETLAQIFAFIFYYHAFVNNLITPEDLTNVDSMQAQNLHAVRQRQIFNMIKILEATGIVRIIRLTIYLDELKTFRIIMESVKSLLAPFWSIITVQFCIFFIYALTGMLLFGGMIQSDTEAIRNNDTTPDIWALINFNDFPSSLVTLFTLMVVNNWMITVEMYTILWGSQTVLFYFISFYTVAVLIGLNIIVCFAIDMYAAIRRLDTVQTEHEEKLYQLALQVKKGKANEDGWKIQDLQIDDTGFNDTVIKTDQIIIRSKSGKQSSASKPHVTGMKNLNDYMS